MSTSDAEREKEARRWLRYAEDDLEAAEAILATSQLAPRLTCWHAQQAAEKALKGALVSLGIDFPFTHDLEALLALLPPGWQAKDDELDVEELSQWAIEARYPGNWPEPSKGDAGRALAQARAVVESVRADLARRRA